MSVFGACGGCCFSVFDLLEGIKFVCPLCRFGFGVVM